MILSVWGAAPEPSCAAFIPLQPERRNHPHPLRPHWPTSPGWAGPSTKCLFVPFQPKRRDFPSYAWSNLERKWQDSELSSIPQRTLHAQRLEPQVPFLPEIHPVVGKGLLEKKGYISGRESPRGWAFQVVRGPSWPSQTTESRAPVKVGSDVHLCLL